MWKLRRNKEIKWEIVKYMRVNDVNAEQAVALVLLSPAHMAWCLLWCACAHKVHFPQESHSAVCWLTWSPLQLLCQVPIQQPRHWDFVIAHARHPVVINWILAKKSRKHIKSCIVETCYVQYNVPSNAQRCDQRSVKGSHHHQFTSSRITFGWVDGNKKNRERNKIDYWVYSRPLSIVTPFQHNANSEKMVIIDRCDYR